MDNVYSKSDIHARVDALADRVKSVPMPTAKFIMDEVDKEFGEIYRNRIVVFAILVRAYAFKLSDIISEIGPWKGLDSQGQGFDDSQLEQNFQKLLKDKIS